MLKFCSSFLTFPPRLIFFDSRIDGNSIEMNFFTGQSYPDLNFSKMKKHFFFYPSTDILHQQEHHVRWRGTIRIHQNTSEYYSSLSVGSVNFFQLNDHNGMQGLYMQGAAGQTHDPVAGGAQPVRDDSRDGVGGLWNGRRGEGRPDEVTVRPCWTWSHLGLSGR